MSSICIKNMDKPKNCYSCLIKKRNGNDIICPITNEHFSIKDNNILVYRLSSCPISPMLQSRWILKKHGEGMCENCKFTQTDVYDYDNWQNYCGHCGAEMTDAISYDHWQTELKDNLD